MRLFLWGSLLVLFSAIFLTNTEAAPETPSQKQNPLTELQAEYPGASILLDDRTGLPIVIANMQSESRRGGAALQVAQDFLQSRVSLLMPGGSPSELQLVKVQKRRNVEHVHFQQVYGSVPVYGGTVSVHVQDGQVVMYTGSYHPTEAFRNLSLQPQLSTSQAEGIAIQELGGVAAQALRGDVQIARYIYPAESGQYHLVYQVNIPAAVPLGDWEVLIDAHTGAVLSRMNRLQHADAVIQRGTDGIGTVYQENPLTTRIPVDEVLPNLDGSGFLKGDFANILVYRGPAGVRIDTRQFDSGLRNNAFSAEGDFRYALNDSRYDEANVYFHIDRIHDYFSSRLDFTELDHPLPAIVGYPAFDERTGRVLDAPMNNAFYSTFKQRLAIGTGNGRANGGLNNLARDADVLYHEYTHAVVDQIVPLGVVPNDFGRAMGEAYADYFACSFFDNPDMGEWSVNRQSGMRNLNNANRFPDDIFYPGTNAPEEHYTSLIFSGALWTLREKVGQVAEQLVFESLYFLPQNGNSTFQIGLMALLQADESFFDGIHQEVIEDVFLERGICDPSGCPLVSGETVRASISNAELLGLNQYTIEVTDATEAVDITLKATVNSRDIDLYVRLNEPIDVFQQRFRRLPQITADFRSESPTGTESITMTPASEPKLQPGTYYVAIVNWESSPNLIAYDLTATITSRTPTEVPPTRRVELRLTAAATTVQAGRQQRFEAKVEGTDNTAVIWQVNGIPGGNSEVGTIGADGVYTAPEGVEDELPVTITAISAADRDIRAEILVSVTPSPVEEVIPPVLDIPERSVLLPNYPNPFNPETWIPYELAKPSRVIISIYDAHGRQVRQLDVGQKAAGIYVSREQAAYWDGRDNLGEVVANGIYFYHIEASDFQATRRMAVVK